MSDWKNVQYKDGKLRTNNGGSGGASALSGLTDVDLTNIADGQILKWDATNSKWVNANESSGSSGHTYSTTEQVVGTWIDGKTLYEITVSRGFSANEEYQIATGINEMFLTNVMFDYSPGRRFSEFYISTSSVSSCRSLYIETNNGTSTATWQSNTASNNVTFTVRYTKT